MTQAGRALSFSQVQQWGVTGGVAGRLLLAALLGGAIGLDREYHRKASGMRTNLLICFGAALFTFLSPLIAGEGSTNKGQIASNIVQGVGFLGAGLIIHNRNRISGLTSAATVFAVAAIGMACGAGLYVTAILATVLVFIVVETVGDLETRLNIKMQLRLYELRGENSPEMQAAVLSAMDRHKRRLDGLVSDSIGATQRISFAVSATRSEHLQLQHELEGDPACRKVLVFPGGEED